MTTSVRAVATSANFQPPASGACSMQHAACNVQQQQQLRAAEATAAATTTTVAGILSAFR